ncbi:LysR family transcriptional regulator [Sphingosinicella rhizophila]|uniref:LysR substrate-binding domain-containing protein n=1 Tax=Sphingosinicella rhizophila TaxID=3050082 RepID=A0ABU3Q6V3_9SPHN|nr:LysR substrate-binding domain-containing protein [Sphingosinicella sp. GR2756]MDT9599115.1 LysR substrate-binding domain-containing protein [Sphingosinicella sp. GR2756]
MERSSVDLLDVLAFVRVVETGAFSRAAERMGISKSILSRRVKRLEQQLGAHLLTRSAAGTQPTNVGQAYFERAANILAELEAAQEVVAESVTQIAGPIRLSAPFSFGTSYLAPALAEFAAEHPQVALDISFDDRHIDLAAGGFDLAVRIGALPDSALIARRIAPVRKHALASPGYLERRGRPAHPRDLGGHDVLLYGNEQWRFRIGEAWEHVRVQPRLRADNGEMLRAAAEAGLGICILPSFIAAPAIEAGTLEVLLIDYPLEEAGLHAVMPPGRATTMRVRALIDFLAGRFGPEPFWDPCWVAGQDRAGRDGRSD